MTEGTGQMSEISRLRPFDRPFDKLTVPRKVEGLKVLSTTTLPGVEGLRATARQDGEPGRSALRQAQGNVSVKRGIRGNRLRTVNGSRPYQHNPLHLPEIFA
jgi:hypothetical protein